MNERPSSSGRVGIGNRSIDTGVPASGEPSSRRILETFAMLGVFHEQALELTPEQIFEQSIREAEELTQEEVMRFQVGLPPQQQDEIREANRGPIGVHIPEYALLRRRGIDHENALVLAQEAARIRFGDPASDQPT